jgi:hypothetical protein
MIRLFVVFCKLNYKNLSAIDLFLKSIEKFAPANIPFIKLPCPCCGAKNPGWSYHDSYKRYLISFYEYLRKISNQPFHALWLETAVCSVQKALVGYS